MNKVWVRLLLLAVLVAGIALAVVYRGDLSVNALEQWVAELGAAGPLMYMLLYVLATVLFLPGSVITLTGGAIFGPLWGTLYTLLGATLGAVLAFLIARYLAGDWAERRAGGVVGKLKQGVEAEGWRFVAFVRLVPLFPFNVLNYALGLTRIRLLHYTLASLFCMLPGALAYTYIGYLGREAVGGGEGLVQKALLGLALLATVLFLPGLVARLRQGPMLSVDELKARLADAQAPLVLDVRSAEEFNNESGHISEAINIPVEQLADRLAELRDYEGRAVVVVCHTDKRSAKAARLLTKQGFTDVHVIKQGMTAWRAAGYPLVPTT